MTKKAILFKEVNFPMVSFLSTGYWLGEDTLTYYNDEGKQAVGDMLGKIVLVEHCNKLILEEFYSGLYNVEFAHVEVEQLDFNRRMDSSDFKNWVGWTTKHKRYVLVEQPEYNWITKYKVN